MSWVAVGVGGAALVGGIGGAVISSNGAKDAAATQAQAANQANQLQYQEFQQQQQNQTPWRQAGEQALSQMQDPSFNQTFNPSDMESVDPGYKFRMQQGQDALERSAAARGGLQNGGTLKAIAQYGQDYASGEYQNAYNRFTNDQTNRFNRLASLAGIGQTANAQLGQAGQTMAGQVGSNMMGAANAAGAAGIAGANAWGSTLSSLGSGVPNSLMQYQQMNNMNNWMNRMAPPASADGSMGLGSSLGQMQGGPLTYNSQSFGAIAGS